MISSSPYHCKRWQCFQAFWGMDSRTRAYGRSRRFSYRLIAVGTIFLASLSVFALLMRRPASERKNQDANVSPTVIGTGPAGCEAMPRPARPEAAGKFYLHYIRFKPDDPKISSELRFTEYLSVMSAVQYLKPDEILVHGDIEPTGEYWNTLKSKGVLKHVYKNLTSFVGRRQGKDKKIAFKEHSADIAKLDALLEYGGIVVDFDVFFVRGERIKEVLERKKAIVCYGDADGHCVGFVAAKADSKLLWAWRRSYTDIYVDDWNFNQAFVAKYLAILYRDETYLARGICDNPHPDRNLGEYFHSHGKIKWTNSMAIHSYERWGGVPITGPEDLRKEPLTTHKELLLTIYENRALPPFDSSFNDEVDPLVDDCKGR